MERARRDPYASWLVGMTIIVLLLGAATTLFVRDASFQDAYALPQARVVLKSESPIERHFQNAFVYQRPYSLASRSRVSGIFAHPPYDFRGFRWLAGLANGLNNLGFHFISVVCHFALQVCILFRTTVLSVYVSFPVQS